MSYQGFSRTYRPQTFATVLGQEAIVTTIKNALLQKKCAQAYLFCGTRGTGKTTLARVLAKALNCQNLSPEGEPCNACPSCLEITQGKSLQVIEIDGASNRGIDDIRQINEAASYATGRESCKVFIIDEVHMLTKEAFNALLKTLEEPPPNVKFFLATTEPHKIPPTILSRCQRFDLQRIQTEKILHKLIHIATEQSVAFEEEAFYRIATLSDGSMRVAESLLDQVLCFVQGPLTTEAVSQALAIESQEAFFAFDTAFQEGNLAFAFTWAQKISSSGKDFLYFLDCLMEHYRNVLAMQMRISLSDLPPSWQEKYRNSATLYTQEQALYILDYLVLWHQQVAKTPFKRVGLEMLLLHVLRSRHRVSATDLVARLEQIKQTDKEPVILSPATPDTSTTIPVEKPQKNPAKKPEPLIVSPPSNPIPQMATVAPAALGSIAGSHAKYDTLIRFACVELEGTCVKK